MSKKDSIKKIAERAVADVASEAREARETAYNKAIDMVRKYGKRAGFCGHDTPADHAIAKIEELRDSDE